MAILREQISGLSNLATWLNANCTGLFGSVTYSSNTLTATDKDNNKVLELTATSCKAYRAESSYLESTMASGGFSTTDVIACDNGVILKTSYTYNIERTFGVLISKTGTGKLAIIFSAGSTNSTNDNYAYYLLKHVAFGDSATLSTTTTFTPENGQQTIMCTFGTNASITSVSVTPKAFYMPMHSAYDQGIGKFLCGGKVYITNGYWCIDTETYEEDAT